MRSVVISSLISVLDEDLKRFGFSCVQRGLHYVRNVSNVFHNIEIILEEGTSSSDNGIRVKLFADIWSPFFKECLKDWKQYPIDYEPLIGGRVSESRIDGNGFVDIDSVEDIELGKLDELLSLIKTKVLPWFQLFHTLQSTKQVLEMQGVEYEWCEANEATLTALNNKFPRQLPVDIQDYHPVNEPVDVIYLKSKIVPLFREHLQKLGFIEDKDNGKPIFVNKLANDTLCSVSFELLDAAFLRVWVHVMKPEFLPEGYWQTLSKQYLVPPLIGKPINSSSICLLSSASEMISENIDNDLEPLLQELSDASGLKAFVADVAPGGLLGKELEELLEIV